MERGDVRSRKVTGVTRPPILT
jgi:hypothetical protein